MGKLSTYPKNHNIKKKDNLGSVKDGKTEWFIKQGKYGMYVMKKGNPPTFVSIPAGTDPSQITVTMIKEQQVKKASKPTYKNNFTKKKNNFRKRTNV